MLNPEEYRRYDALALAKLLERGEVSPRELQDAARAAIEASNDEINAVVTPLWDEAAEFLSQGTPAAPFRGVPFLLKDLNQQYRGAITSNGSRLFADNRADHDSTLVGRYKASGLVICGKTNTPELGLATTTEPVLHGPTRNPWNLQHTAGGSSGGAAAAVAAGYVPMAHATDGGGSIRVPASCCGLFGLKPTRGRVPLGPDALEGWGGLSTAHAVTRTVRDSAALLDVSAGEEPGSPYFAPPRDGRYLDQVGRDPGRLRIGLCLDAFNGADLDPQVGALTERAARDLAGLGHEVEIARVAVDAEAFRSAHGAIAVSHASAALSAYAERLGRPVTEQDVETVTWLNHLEAQRISGAGYARAVGVIHQLGRQVTAFFDTFDLLLTPTMACLPPKLGELNMMDTDQARYLSLLYRMIAFTALFNDSGHPAVSLPLARSANGLPVGVQLVAPFGAEALLFRVAAQAESGGLFLPGP